MLLRKSTVALGASCNGFIYDWSLVTSSTSSGRPRPSIQGSPAIAPPSADKIRRYAAVKIPRDTSRSGDRHRDQGIPRWPSSPNPTPYDILGLAKDAPYSKIQFYELVKLYHPDRLQHNHDNGIPEPMKIERYRLAVAANDILCDPAKRRLYDLHGIGWLEPPDTRHSYRDIDRNWRRQPGNASMNATWEDWERWYDARDGKKPEPVYMSNGGFAFIIGLFVIIAAWGQATRAGNRGRSIVEMREKEHRGVSSDLRRRQIGTSNLTKEARVDTFLKQREGWDIDQPCGPGRSPLERRT